MKKEKKITQNLKVTYVPISELKPSEYNPRSWSDEAIRQLKESIKRFGVVDPLLCNSAPKRQGVLIGGHFRLKILKELGYKKVPVVYLNIPDPEKEKELNLRLNRNTGDWDFELLKEFNIETLLDVGFDDSDLSNIWDDIMETEDDDFDVKKELEQIKKPKTKLGDVFQLGPHVLICGDSTDINVVKQLTDKNSVAMIYSDPPYNINLNYSKGIGSKKNYGGKTKDNKSDVEYKEFLRESLKNGLSICQPDCHVFYYCDEKYIWLVQSLYQELGIENKRVCLWIKNNQNPTPQVAFNKVYEPCVYGTVGKPYLSSIKNLNEILNKEIGTGNRTLDDILDLFNIWLEKRKTGVDYDHPTEKPPTLHEKAIRRCTKPGDIILDLFAGSGSTLVAAHQMKRTAYLVEIEPIFCDLIIKRYERISNKRAKKLN